MSDETSSHSVQDRIRLTDGREGIIRYIGKVHLYKGVWYGVELTDGSTGKHDGTVDGQRYFVCSHSAPHQRAGVFVTGKKIKSNLSFDPPDMPQSNRRGNNGQHRQQREPREPREPRESRLPRKTGPRDVQAPQGWKPAKFTKDVDLNRKQSNFLKEKTRRTQKLNVDPERPHSSPSRAGKGASATPEPSDRTRLDAKPRGDRNEGKKIKKPQSSKLRSKQQTQALTHTRNGFEASSKESTATNGTSGRSKNVGFKKHIDENTDPPGHVKNKESESFDGESDAMFPSFDPNYVNSQLKPINQNQTQDDAGSRGQGQTRPKKTQIVITPSLDTPHHQPQQSSQNSLKSPVRRRISFSIESDDSDSYFMMSPKDPAMAAAQQSGHLHRTLSKHSVHSSDDLVLAQDRQGSKASKAAKQSMHRAHGSSHRRQHSHSSNYSSYSNYSNHSNRSGHTGHQGHQGHQGHHAHQAHHVQNSSSNQLYRKENNLSPLPRGASNNSFARRFDSFGRRVSFSSVYDDDDSESSLDSDDPDNSNISHDDANNSNDAQDEENEEEPSPKERKERRERIKISLTDTPGEAVKGTVGVFESQKQTIRIHRTSGHSDSSPKRALSARLSMSHTAATPQKNTFAAAAAAKKMDANGNTLGSPKFDPAERRRTPIIRRVSRSSDEPPAFSQRHQQLEKQKQQKQQKHSKQQKQTKQTKQKNQANQPNRASLSSPKSVNTLIKRFEKIDADRDAEQVIARIGTDKKAKQGKQGKGGIELKQLKRTKQGRVETPRRHGKKKNEAKQDKQDKYDSPASAKSPFLDSPRQFQSPGSSGSPGNAKLDPHPGFISPAPSDYGSSDLPQLPVLDAAQETNGKDAKRAKQGKQGKQGKSGSGTIYLTSPENASVFGFAGAAAGTAAAGAVAAGVENIENGGKVSKIAQTRQEKKRKNKQGKGGSGKKVSRSANPPGDRAEHRKNGSGLHISSPGFNVASGSYSDANGKERKVKQKGKNKKGRDEKIQKPRAKDLKMKSKKKMKSKARMDDDDRHHRKKSSIIVTDWDEKRSQRGLKSRGLDLKIDTAAKRRSPQDGAPRIMKQGTLSPYADNVMRQKYHHRARDHTPSYRKGRRYSFSSVDMSMSSTNSKSPMASPLPYRNGVQRRASFSSMDFSETSERGLSPLPAPHWL